MNSRLVNKNEKKRKVVFLSKSYLGLILIASFIMGIGYASINLITSTIGGDAIASAYEGVLITNVELVGSKNASSSVNNYYHTMLDTDVVLDSGSIDSYITYEVTFYNNLTSDTYFLGVTKDDLFYTDLDGNVNNDIIYYYDSNIVGTKFLEGTEMSIEITFKYSDSVDDTDLNNNLHSYIDFQFNASENLVLGENLLISDNFVASTYIDKSGGEVSYNNWSASEYIPVSMYDMIFIKSSSGNLEDWNAFYDENKNFVKNVNITKLKIVNQKIENVYLNLSCLKIPEGVHYLRVSAKTVTLNSVKIYPVLNEDYNRILNFSMSSFLPLIFSDNLYNTADNSVNTYVNKSNGNLVTYSGWTSSDFIDISGYEKVAVTTTGSYLSSWNAFYDENKNFISAFSLSSTESFAPAAGYFKSVTIPSGARYIRVSESNSIMNNIKIFGVQTDKDAFSGVQSLEVGENIFDVSSLISNVYIETNGTEVSYSNWSASDYIDLSSSDMWIVTGGSSFLSTWNALYDENKNFIKTQDMSTFNLESKVFGYVGANMFFYLRPDNVKYIRMSELSSIMKTIKIFPVYKINGVFTFEIPE